MLVILYAVFALKPSDNDTRMNTDAFGKRQNALSGNGTAEKTDEKYYRTT